MLVPSPRGDGEKVRRQPRMRGAFQLLLLQPPMKWRSRTAATSIAPHLLRPLIRCCRTTFSPLRGAKGRQAFSRGWRCVRCAVLGRRQRSAPHPVLPHHLLPAARGEGTGRRFLGIGSACGALFWGEGGERPLICGYRRTCAFARCEGNKRSAVRSSNDGIELARWPDVRLHSNPRLRATAGRIRCPPRVP